MMRHLRWTSVVCGGMGMGGITGTPRVNAHDCMTTVAAHQNKADNNWSKPHRSSLAPFVGATVAHALRSGVEVNIAGHIAVSPLWVPTFSFVASLPSPLLPHLHLRSLSVSENHDCDLRKHKFEISTTAKERLNQMGWVSPTQLRPMACASGHRAFSARNCAQFMMLRYSTGRILVGKYRAITTVMTENAPGTNFQPQRLAPFLKTGARYLRKRNGSLKGAFITLKEGRC